MCCSGRQLLMLLKVPLRHDMYVIAAGCYSLWAACKVLAWLWRLTSSHNLTGNGSCPLLFCPHSMPLLTPCSASLIDVF